MSGRVSEQTLEEIRQRTDIVDLIGSRVTLKRGGADFKACCPFHKEKTPSFIVSPARRTFHCFGCGAHGDVFKFLMMSDGMTFMDAVKSLAQRTGVTLDLTEDYEAAARGVLFRLHTELAAFYQRCLRQIPEAQKARDYLASRKLDAETVENFGIGYAPDAQGIVLTWASKHNFTAEQLVTAGVLTPPREGHSDNDYYDRFHGRLMFPIRNATGQVIGFSGRILTNDKKIAKYVNSPETPIFHKGEVLYALDFARKNIVKNSRREALVCEGQIDVIRCHASGFGTAVASQGTAFTEDHVKLLKRYADSAVLVFDGDSAGLKAAVRTGRLFLQAGIPVQVATLPENEDPDSLLRDKGPEAFQAILNAPESLVAFQIRSLRAAESDPNAIDALSRITSQVIETISDCKQAVMRSYLEQEAAELLGVPVDALQSDLSGFLEKKAASEKWKDPVPAKQITAKTEFRGTTYQPRQTPSPQVAPPRPKPTHVESALTSIAEMLLHSPEDAELFKCVAEWLPAQVMGDVPEALVINAAIADQQTGSEYIAVLSENGEQPVKALLEKLSTREAKALHSHEVTPIEAACDLIARAWADYMKRKRASLNISNPEECRRRLELSAAIKKIESTKNWAERANAIYPEYERIAQESAEQQTAEQHSGESRQYEATEPQC